MPGIIGYFGPETVMPVTSVIATVFAFFMMFGRVVFRTLAGWLLLLRRPREESRKLSPGPHFAVQQEPGQEGVRTEDAKDRGALLRD